MSLIRKQSLLNALSNTSVNTPVLSYLNELVDSTKISDDEIKKIDTSISWLINSIKSYGFYPKVSSVFCFGSYHRGTLLPRIKDSSSDVDIMIVFDDEYNCRPQTFLNKIKDFVNKKYPNSIIKQDHPTIKLELNHISFDLVPSVGTYRIPASSGLYGLQWISTYPLTFKDTVNNKHKNNNYKIKSLIRLMKLWNSKNDKPISSFELEEYIVNRSYLLCLNLKEYFYSCVDNISSSFCRLPDYKKSKLQTLERLVQKAQENEKEGYNYLAKGELEKIFK